MSYSGRTCIPRSGDSCHSIQSENHHSWIPNFPNWLFQTYANRNPLWCAVPSLRIPALRIRRAIEDPSLVITAPRFAEEASAPSRVSDSRDPLLRFVERCLHICP